MSVPLLFFLCIQKSFSVCTFLGWKSEKMEGVCLMCVFYVTCVCTRNVYLYIYVFGQTRLEDYTLNCVENISFDKSYFEAEMLAHFLRMSNGHLDAQITRTCSLQHFSFDVCVIFQKHCTYYR